MGGERETERMCDTEREFADNTHFHLSSTPPGWSYLLGSRTRVSVSQDNNWRVGNHYIFLKYHVRNLDVYRLSPLCLCLLTTCRWAYQENWRQSHCSADVFFCFQSPLNINISINNCCDVFFLSNSFRSVPSYSRLRCLSRVRFLSTSTKPAP